MILVGRGEWEGLLEWLRVTALADHRIDRADMASLRMAASPKEVVQIVSAARERQKTHAEGLRRRARRP